MSENFTWREQLKTNFKINVLFSILWANPHGVTRAQMSQISGDVFEIVIAIKNHLPFQERKEKKNKRKK